VGCTASLPDVAAVDVQYKSAPDSLNDLASGTLDFALYDPIVSMSQAQAGRVRVLEVGSKERLPAAPDLPTMAEQGIPIDILSWFAALVPSATPRPIVNQINAWFGLVLAMPETRAFLTKFGTEPWIATPEEGQAQMIQDLAIWPEYIRVAKLKPQD
jgi:tripartite-type tricarboxylate transporter receptor subunit TctC